MLRFRVLVLYHYMFGIFQDSSSSLTSTYVVVHRRPVIGTCCVITAGNFFPIGTFARRSRGYAHSKISSLYSQYSRPLLH
ncbi:hypothetical protein F5Y17DRAFT_435788 [Xylariaceae sp. FL0594]|nr:hypothetical protein F5Y17DRAFT_435788 [Xylariaceae sp. FL0594]